MLNQIVIATVSALVGGLITIIITYLNNKAKRFELEYSYRKKIRRKISFKCSETFKRCLYSIIFKVNCFSK